VRPKDGRETVEKAKQVKPDIVILDVGMPNLNGLAATRQLLQQKPSTEGHRSDDHGFRPSDPGGS